MFIELLLYAKHSVKSSGPSIEQIDVVLPSERLQAV